MLQIGWGAQQVVKQDADSHVGVSWHVCARYTRLYAYIACDRPRYRMLILVAAVQTASGAPYARDAT